jgi:predicted TIM-barrel fold metal-dependent hydrolase
MRVGAYAARMRTLHRTLVVAVVAALALTACPPQAPAGSAGKTKDGKKEKDDDNVNLAAEPDGRDRTKRPPIPPPPEADKIIKSLEAEVAALKQELSTGKRAVDFPGTINAHEHLYKVADLDRYLPAARKKGIAATVVVSSPKFTLEGKGDEKGEPSASKNFEDVVLVAAQKYPGEIIPFCTIDPHDKDKLNRLKKHVDQGAKGIKIYSGHSNYYDGPLDTPEMDEVWSYLEDTQLPINWHVNYPKFSGDFERVMKKHPRLNIMVPHYAVTFWKPSSAATKKWFQLMRDYPNIYVDTSLGTREILLDGMVAMEAEKAMFQQMFTEFQDRIVWGTDSVITGNAEKTVGWYSIVIDATRDQLEKDVFTTPLAAAYSKYFQKGRDGEGRYQGLGLSTDILRKVYVDNPKRWLRIK